ncbi:glycosyltransferase family 4 protein [Microbacterium tenebrionis]|uniref:glycosyltransferase family 4 protein n=1 Tax=Microbacterium tenebrionis TaxID=2830665 RepID=UPI0015892688|nr:glycosyltransferase family 4 protein [Microbacterium ihumii]
MTRVALVTSSFAPYIGGVETHVREVARELAGRGHDIEVWSVARDGVPGERVDSDIVVRDLPAPLPARDTRAVLRFAQTFAAARRTWSLAIANFGPEILHVQCFGPNGAYGTAFARSRGLPLVVSSHGETIADDDDVFGSSAIAQHALRRALRDAAAVTGCSPVVLDDLRGRFGLAAGRGEVVPNGVEPSIAAEPPAGLPSVYFAGAGRLEHIKGFDLLVRAFAAAGLGPDVELVLGGDGRLAPSLRSLIDELGLSSRVRLLGRLSPPAVAGLLEGALAVVVPSRFEAFGIAVLEAWRARRPLVAADRGGIPGLVRDGVDGLLVDPEDETGFARVLERIARDGSLRERIAREGALNVERFRWADVAARYEAIYDRIAGGFG